MTTVGSIQDNMTLERIRSVMSGEVVSTIKYHHPATVVIGLAPSREPLIVVSLE